MFDQQDQILQIAFRKLDDNHVGLLLVHPGQIPQAAAHVVLDVYPVAEMLSQQRDDAEEERVMKEQQTWQSWIGIG